MHWSLTTACQEAIKCAMDVHRYMVHEAQSIKNQATRLMVFPETTEGKGKH